MDRGEAEAILLDALEGSLPPPPPFWASEGSGAEDGCEGEACGRWPCQCNNDAPGPVPEGER